MKLSLNIASPEQYTSLYGIMALAGEHMHRVLGLSHWYPFPSSERFIARLDGREIFGVYADQILVGTFNISTIPEPYYLEDMSDYWTHTDIPPMYFSGFALLPSYQQQGIGTWCLQEMDKMVQERGFKQVRFDAVNTHEKLKHFYRRSGYQECGVLDLGHAAVMCFEKRFED